MRLVKMRTRPNTNNMPVSIVIPTFNRLGPLQRAVRSVICQTYRNWELWIIDDGSTDGTPSWVFDELLPNNKKIHYVRTKNLGVSHARNLGIRLSQGPWVAFLDSDDEWLYYKLAIQMQLAQESSFKILHGEEIWIRNGVRVNPHKKHQKSGGRVFKRSVDLCCMSPSTVVIHRESLLSEVLFREDFPVCEDYDLWLRLTSKWDVGFVSQPLIKKYGGHRDQLSRKYVAMDYWRLKSLITLKHCSYLDKGEREYLKRNVRKRAEILLRGYKKHNNEARYKEVERIILEFQK